MEQFSVSFIIVDKENENDKVYNSKELLNKINKLLINNNKIA